VIWMRIALPLTIQKLMAELKDAGYQVYLAGESLRDCLIGLLPEEWDVVTDAPPELVDLLFDRACPVGRTAGLMMVDEGGLRIKIFTNGLQGENGTPTGSCFTVNAMAWDPFSDTLIDPGQAYDSLKSELGIIQVAGVPLEVFPKEPLHMLEIFYLMKRFDDAGYRWHVDPATWGALMESAPAIQMVHPYCLRHLFNKIIIGSRPDSYFGEMQKAGLLEYALPEIAATCGIIQNDYHIKDVFGHTLLVMKEIRPELHLRWAALLHDIGKPYCIGIEDGVVHFYGHQAIGSRLSHQILNRLGFDSDFIERVAFLVHRHMYPYPRTRRAVRRFINRVGLRALADLLELRRADIMGGKYKNLGRLNCFERDIEAVLFELPPFSIKDLDVDGYDVMEALSVKPGPAVGSALQFLFERVLQDPDLNERETLLDLLKKEWPQ